MRNNKFIRITSYGIQSTHMLYFFITILVYFVNYFEFSVLTYTSSVDIVYVVVSQITVQRLVRMLSG